MISSLRGTVVHIGLGSAVIEVGGVGFHCFATPATLAGLHLGAEARVATALVVREDSLTLFGFADDDERGVFETLQTVTGVGPRLALAVLSVHTPETLRRAVDAEDIAALQRVPGIGRKGAQRMLIELAGKLGPAQADAPGEVAPGGSGAFDTTSADVIEALVGLGWQEKAATEAVEKVRADLPSGAQVNAADLLRAALQLMGGAHV